jgi:hypothetical protein
MSDTEYIGEWGKPLDSRRWHIFKDGRSIGSSCGWMYFGAEETVNPEEDSFTDGQDCKSCCRAAGLLTGENDE